MDTFTSTDGSSEATSQTQSSESFDSGSSSDSGQSAGGAHREESGASNVPRGTNGDQPKSEQQRQRESRYERTKRERAEFKAQQQQFLQEREALARERAEFAESKKPKRDYSLKDLKKYRNEWAKEAEQGIDGREELVIRADAEIAAMEAEEANNRQTLEIPSPGTPEHANQWRQMEAQIKNEEPDFMVQGTPLDTEIRKLLAGPNGDTYRRHPQGIYAAYSEAKKIVLTEENGSLRSENQQLKDELKRFTGLTSIGSGSPGRIGGGDAGKEFSHLSSTEMRKRLTQDKRNGVGPWL